MNKVAIYPGTFDPITYGHIDVIKKALKLFDKIIVGVSDVSNKNYLFNSEERINIVNKALFNDLKLSKKKILEITNLIGSDVILGITPNNTVLSSNNIIKKFSRGPNFHTLLIRPNFGCSTKKIYSGVKKYTKPAFNIPKQNMFSLRFLLKQENALEKIAFLKYPKLKVLKSFLENLNQPLFVRMTGSGSVLVAYYQKKQDCDLAKVQFKRKFKNYWCITSKTI